MLREIERLRCANQIFLRCSWRKYRSLLILLSVQPGDEQHLDGSTAIPVSLFEIRRNPANTGAESLRNKRRQSGIAFRCDCKLPFGGRRTADDADLAIRPRLFGYPCQLIFAIGQRRSKNVVIPF